MKSIPILLTTALFLSLAAIVEAQNGRGPRGGGQGRCGYCALYDPAAPLQSLDSQEAARLTWMREEEKLARDIYQALFEKWRLRIFGNIAASEQRHFDAIGVLIARYELTNRAQPTPGVFTDPDLQKLYADLLAKGQKSLNDALQVGISIEEMNIEDLKNSMAATDNRDIQAVYGNLMSGSQKHLSAFSSHPKAAGRR